MSFLFRSDPKNKQVMGTLTFFMAVMATMPLFAFAIVWVLAKEIYGGESQPSAPFQPHRLVLYIILWI